MGLAFLLLSTYTYDLTQSSIIREATAKSKDGRIDQSDFMNHCVSSTRYSLFTPQEASIIFHFAGRGSSSQRLALIDFAQLLDPRWHAPAEPAIEKLSKSSSVLNQIAHSAYNFGLGGMYSHGVPRERRGSLNTCINV